MCNRLQGYRRARMDMHGGMMLYFMRYSYAVFMTAIFDRGWKPFTKESSGLVDNTVFSIAIKQNAGNPVIWFGTLSGLSRMEPSTGQWQSYSGQDINLGWGGVSDLFFGSTGKLWVCSEGGGISRVMARFGRLYGSATHACRILRSNL
jgi:hypothetical protein